MNHGEEPVPLVYHDLVKRFFRGSGYRTMDALAKALEVTPAHVTQLFLPPNRGGRLPSRKLMDRLARTCGRTADQRKLFRRLLYQARWAAEFSDVPPRVPASMLPPLEMPAAFCLRLRRDLKGMGIIRQRAAARAAAVSYRHLREVLRGEGLFDRWQVSRLAKQLGQDTETYLTLAGYIPAGARPLVAKTPGIAAFTGLSRAAYSEMFKAMFGPAGRPEGKGRRHGSSHPSLPLHSRRTGPSPTPASRD